MRALPRYSVEHIDGVACVTDLGGAVSITNALAFVTRQLVTWHRVTDFFLYCDGNGRWDGVYVTDGKPAAIHFLDGVTAANAIKLYERTNPRRAEQRRAP